MLLPLLSQLLLQLLHQRQNHRMLVVDKLEGMRAMGMFIGILMLGMSMDQPASTASPKAGLGYPIPRNDCLVATLMLAYYHLAQIPLTANSRSHLPGSYCGSAQ